MRWRRVDTRFWTIGRTGQWILLVCLAAAGLTIGSCGNDTPAAPPPPSPTPIPQPTPNPAPTPDPNATPASCPTLTRWSSGIHNITDAESKQIPWPLVGGHVLIDSTPLFAGRPCNSEQDFCGGRKCEDPRGPVWQLVEGESRTDTRGYQFRIGPLTAGFHRWSACPRPDVRDAQGVPVEVRAGGACSEGSFVVLTEPPTE